MVWRLGCKLGSVCGNLCEAHDVAGRRIKLQCVHEEAFRNRNGNGGDLDDAEGKLDDGFERRNHDVTNFSRKHVLGVGFFCDRNRSIHDVCAVQMSSDGGGDCQADVDDYGFG